METVAGRRPGADGRADSGRHEFPEAGHRVGRRGASILRHAGQGGELPSGGDRRRCGPAPARGCWARRCICRRPGSRRRSGPVHRFRRPCASVRSGNWRSRSCGRSAPAASPSPRCWAMRNSATAPPCGARCIGPICRMRLGVSSDFTAFLGTPALVAPPPLTGRGRPRTRGRLSPDTQTFEARTWAAAQPRARVAARLVAQRHPPAVARPVLRGPRDARARLARATAGARGLVAVRTRSRTDAANQVLRGAFAGHRLAPHAGAPGASAMGDRAAIPGTQGRDRARSLRRAQPSGWHRHVVLTAIAYSFLQQERRRRGQTHLTLPQVRAVIQEVLTAHLFITRPDYLRWMLKLKDVELRI